MVNGAVVHEVDKDTVDLSDSAATEAFFAQVGDVDILVNVAGGVEFFVVPGGGWVSGSDDLHRRRTFLLLMAGKKGRTR
jgi:NAD(P)-dependent dehydrogenase (short-subunit alcohol dehydrogenase family)